MNVLLSSLVFCTAVFAAGCSQTAGGDIKTVTDIDTTTNFQLNSDNGQQTVERDSSANNSTSGKGQ